MAAYREGKGNQGGVMTSGLLHQGSVQSNQPQSSSGDILPLPEAPFDGDIGRTVSESTPSRPHVVRPAKGTPNVLVVLLDDVGYAQFETFGGLIPTPALNRLAADGLRYTRYHTTAICSSTRAAMLTGRNAHVSGNGTVTEYATGYPGYNGAWPRSVCTGAEILRLNGYSTALFGKWHNTPNWECGPTGPFDRWPTGQGFEYFYGFVGGSTNQWEPSLYENTRPVVRMEPRHEYHLTTELADRTISWIRSGRAFAPQKPFFAWVAPAATHSPHHAPRSYIERFRGAFDSGWDAYRTAAFERQKKLGVIPADTALSERPAVLPAWDTLPGEEKHIYARMMEVFAAHTAHTDYEIGRIIDALKEDGEFDNTLIVYSVGDNGASGEGGLGGMVNGMSYFNDMRETREAILKNLDALGGPSLFNNIPAGWGWAMNTPFPWLKKAAGHLGAVRNPLVLSWPNQITDKGGLRGQFHHCIDVVPTILDACGLKMPAVVNGAAQTPLDGLSMAYTFDDAKAQDRRAKQYFECLGNRGIYYKGWWAGVLESLPWGATRQIDLDKSRWELYDLANDYSQANELSAQHPEKLRELQDVFWSEAGRLNVLPLDSSTNERMLQARTLTQTEQIHRYTLYSGMVGILEAVAPDVKNRSFSIVAHVRIPQEGAEGVVVAMGGRVGGYSLFVRGDRLHYWYNAAGIEQVCVSSPHPVPRGACTVGVEFDYDGGGLGKGGELRLMVNGACVAKVRLERTVSRMFARETFDIGMDLNSPVGDYQAPFPFTGALERVVFNLH